MSKYRNKLAVVDGITFHSKAEARRYQELLLLQRVGEISELELQPKFLLQDKFRRNNKAIAAIHYIADFKYKENGKTIIEDVKGKETADFKLKMKLFLVKYPKLIFRKSLAHKTTFKTMDY